MRLIDADALNIDIEKEFDGVCVYDVSASEAISDMQNIVDRQPTIEPRKTGHWVCADKYIYNGYTGSYMCDACKDYYTMCPKEMNYCPNCGAKMEAHHDPGK